MPSPIPKDPKLRQRNNKPASRAYLETAERPEDIPEKLPGRGRKRWHRMTQLWWADVRQSPMAGEYLQADIHALFRLAVLIDDFWRTPTVHVAAEIRQQGMAFGLTPIDRRRLEWIVQRVDAGAQKASPAPTRRRATEDPRDLLKVVS